MSVDVFGVEPLAAAIPANVVVLTVTAVPYLIADTTLLAVEDGLVKLVPEIFVTIVGP